MISGVVLARNEASNIVDCLRSLEPHVEELLLIDMESTDDTVELAAHLTRETIPCAYSPNFDAARNLAIPRAQHDWLWYLDADERVPVTTGRRIRELINERGDEIDAVWIPFKSYFCGQWMQHCGWWPGYTMPRVLKRGHFRFSEKLHGGVQVDGREFHLPPDPDCGIEHYSYLSVEHYLEKLNRYTSTEARQLAAEGRAYDWRDSIASFMRDLWIYYEANPGRLDAERGWILSWLSAWYRWLSHAKLIDHDKILAIDGHVNAPVNLDDVLLFMEEELASIRRPAPQLPLAINWRSPIWDYSGYADESRTFIKGLAHHGKRALAVEELCWSDRTCQLPDAERALLNALLGKRRRRFTACITNCIPTLVEPDRCASLNILRTTFETDRIPQDWKSHINAFDEIWLTSTHAERAFRRSWIPPEKLRTVPSCVDTTVYRSSGKKLDRPDAIKDRFVLLSIFEWQLRKGWDLLLPAFINAFDPTDQVALWLKVTRLHGQSPDVVQKGADAALARVGTCLADHPEIVVIDDVLAADQMAALYRAADAFVLPTRGEGWGRPIIEAMACGLPVVVTDGSGHLDFVNQEHAFLVAAQLADVSAEAAAEIPTYAGHRWYEPSFSALVKQMRKVVCDEKQRRKVAKAGARHVRKSFGLKAGQLAVEQALAHAENRFSVRLPSAARAEQARVVLEGEFFAGHSFANLNQQIAVRLAESPEMALSLQRRVHNPVFDALTPDAHRLKPYFYRPLGGTPDVVIKHAFPPDWTPPQGSYWIHIQPWEFGYLPKRWIPPLVNQVDEIWAPSHYVKRVYTDSGVPEDKCHVIPWGVDTGVFHSAADPLLLPVEQSFRFLFVGGTIERKGFDTLLTAYLKEFSPDDDVCLVIKDMGTNSFYSVGNHKQQILEATEDKSNPKILYLDAQLTPGQLASLYTSCHCLVAPYRGEGFGLPILEAMACGLPVVVPRGGPTDDFVDDRCGIRIRCREVNTDHDWPLASTPKQFKINQAPLRKAMRRMFQAPARTAQMGLLASRHAHAHFAWSHVIPQMVDRILGATRSRTRIAPETVTPARSTEPLVAACLRIQDCERTLADALARVKCFVDEIIVVDQGCQDRSLDIAREYGATVLCRNDEGQLQDLVESKWLFWLDPAERLQEDDVRTIPELVATQPTAVPEISLDVNSLQGEHGARKKRIRLLRTASLQAT